MSGEWSVAHQSLFWPWQGNLEKTGSRHGEIGVILYLVLACGTLFPVPCS